MARALAGWKFSARIAPIQAPPTIDQAAATTTTRLHDGRARHTADHAVANASETKSEAKNSRSSRGRSKAGVQAATAAAAHRTVHRRASRSRDRTSATIVSASTAHHPRARIALVTSNDE